MDSHDVVMGEWEAHYESLQSARWINGELIDGDGDVVDVLEADPTDHSLLLAYGGPTVVLTPDPMSRKGMFLLTASYGDSGHSQVINLPHIDGYLIGLMGLAVA